MILEDTVVPAVGGHPCTEAAIPDRGKLKACRVADPAPLGSQAEAELDIRARAHDMGSKFAPDAEMAAVALSESPEGVQDILVVAGTTAMRKG